MNADELPNPSPKRPRQMTIPDNIKEWVILIVDDEPDNVGVASKVLSFQGIEVHTARNGEEALQLLENISPSLILLDLSMPVMDGWTMHARLRENPEYANIPVIALTAHAMASDKHRVLESGFDGYISKPFRIMTLISDIKQCLADD
jgi:CheY-like chemotaxis protein